MKSITLIFVGLLTIQSCWALLIQPEKYPKKLKAARWKSKKTKTLKLLAKVKKVRGMAKLLARAEKQRSYLNVANYQFKDHTELEKIESREQIVSFFDNQEKLWAKERRKLLQTLKKIKIKIAAYLKIIGNKRLLKKSRKRLLKMEIARKAFKKKIKNFNLGEAKDGWVQSAYEQWKIITGEAFVGIAVKNMNAIKGFAKSVATVTQWSSKKVQSQAIRGVGTTMPPLKKKKRVSDEIYNKWKKYSADPWQPKNSGEVADKFGKLLKLIQETEKALHVK